MKKRILALLAAVLLTGCSPAAPEQTTVPGTQQITVPTRKPQQTEQTQTATTTAPEFRELVLVDNEDCVFKITDIRPDDTWGYTLKAYLENKTELNLMFSLDEVSVNGYMCDPFWATTVSAGKKANEDISFSEAELERSGITQVTEITFTLTVYNNDDWTAEKLVDEDFTVYPLGESAVQEQVRQPQPEDIVLFDDERCTMIVTGFDPENTWGYTVNVYLENKTEEDLMFSISGASVNGFMCDPFWAVTVADGKKCNTTITWSESDFQDNGIRQVEVLTLPVQVYEDDDWTAEKLVDDVFEVRPQQ